MNYIRNSIDACIMNKNSKYGKSKGNDVELGHTQVRHYKLKII